MVSHLVSINVKDQDQLYCVVTSIVGTARLLATTVRFSVVDLRTRHPHRSPLLDLAARRLSSDLTELFWVL